MSANAGVAGRGAPIIVVRHEAVNVDQAAPTPGQAWNEPTAGTRPVSSEREPNSTSAASRSTNSAGSRRMRRLTSSMRTRVSVETSARRSPAWTRSIMNLRTRALPRIIRSRTSPSSMRRSRWVPERARRSSPGCANTEIQPATTARARAARPVISKPIASNRFSTKATGSTHTSASAEYDLNRSRTRERISSRSSSAGRSRSRGRRAATTVARPCWTRAAGATITRAPASRARQQRSMSSAPGNVAGSNPPSSWNRSARTSIAACDT